MKHLIVAIFLGVSLFGSYMIFQNRDVVFYWDFAKPVGELRLEDEPVLRDAVDAFLRVNNDNSHGVCLADWLGRDDLYIYAQVLCDDFREEGGQVVRSGQGDLIPTRFEYDPTTNTVQTMEVGNHQEFGSLRTLFPKPIYSLLRSKRQPDAEMLKEGLAKMQTLEPAPEM